MATKRLAQQSAASEAMRRITPCAQNAPKKNHDGLQLGLGEAQNSPKSAPLAPRSPQEGPRWTYFTLAPVDSVDREAHRVTCMRKACRSAEEFYRYPCVCTGGSIVTLLLYHKGLDQCCHLADAFFCHQRCSSIIQCSVFLACKCGFLW